MYELTNFASTRHGVVSREEALACGMSASQLTRSVGKGVLLRLEPSVYGIAGAPDTWHRRARVATLSTGGLLSHDAAAANHRLDGFPQATVEVVIPKSRRVNRQDISVHRTTQFALAAPIQVNGIPTTGLERTVLDLAGTISYRRLEHVVDEVLRERLTSWPDLLDTWVCHSIQGRNGSGPLRRLLEERYGETAIPDSKWNRMVGRLLESAGIGTPDYEFTVRSHDDRFLGRVDLAYPKKQVAIELDSVRWHLNRESFEQDPRRKNTLVTSGWTVLTFTWSDYVDRPWQLIRIVRAAMQ